MSWNTCIFISRDSIAFWLVYFVQINFKAYLFCMHRILLCSRQAVYFSISSINNIRYLPIFYRLKQSLTKHSDCFQLKSFFFLSCGSFDNGSCFERKFSQQHATAYITWYRNERPSTEKCLRVCFLSNLGYHDCVFSSFCIATRNRNTFMLLTSWSFFVVLFCIYFTCMNAKQIYLCRLDLHSTLQHSET